MRDLLSMSPLGVLMVFYMIAALFAWPRVVRPVCFLLGTASIIAGLIFVLIFGFIEKSWAMKVTGILTTIFSIISFASLVFAWYKGAVSFNIAGEMKSAMQEAKGQQPPPQA